MSDDTHNKHDDLAPEEIKPSSPAPRMGAHWGTEKGGRTKLFNNTKDFDIYCDRAKGVNYIFHAGELNCTIDHLEYDHDTQRITVFTNDGQKLDLGSKIQWLVRPYIAREQYIFIIQTKDGKAIDGVQVHLRIKDPPITRDMLKNDEK